MNRGNLKMFLLSSCLFCRCVSKKESFAPGTMYKPFGKEAAGTMTLSQFQTLHEKDQETASLRELGLNETEILIWKSHVSGEKVSGPVFSWRLKPEISSFGTKNLFLCSLTSSLTCL